MLLPLHTNALQAERAKALLYIEPLGNTRRCFGLVALRLPRYFNRGRCCGERVATLLSAGGRSSPAGSMSSFSTPPSFTLAETFSPLLDRRIAAIGLRTREVGDALGHQAVQGIDFGQAKRATRGQYLQVLYANLQVSWQGWPNQGKLRERNVDANFDTKEVFGALFIAAVGK